MNLGKRIVLFGLLRVTSDFVGGADSGSELMAVLCEWPAIRGKANTATTAFARSRLPRSLLTAHSVDAAAGFVGVWRWLL